MRFTRNALAPALALTCSAAIATAHAADIPREIVARHGLMAMIGMNIGVVGQMARGNIEYDATAAQAAADSLMGLSMVSQDALWIEGTSSDDTELSRALPKIWEDRAGFDAAWNTYVTAAAAFQAAAGSGPDEMGAALGALGRSCGGCHDTYRKPKE